MSKSYISPESSSLLNPNRLVSTGFHKSLFKPSALCLATLAAALFAVGSESYAAEVTQLEGTGTITNTTITTGDGKEYSAEEDGTGNYVFKNIALAAYGTDASSFEVSSDFQITTYLEDGPAVNAPDGATHDILSAIVAASNMGPSTEHTSDSLTITSTSTSGTPTITITNSESKPWSSGQQPSNYAIVAYSGAILTITGVNLNLNSVIEGIFAGRATTASNGVASYEVGVVNIKDNDFVYVQTVAKGDALQSYAIMTLWGSTVSIENSTTVTLNVGAAEEVDNKAAMSAGLFQDNGGTISITKGKDLTINVSVDNTSYTGSQNFGAYIIGGYTGNSANRPSYVGIAELAGSGSLDIKVTGATENYGIANTAYAANSTVTADFNSISMQSYGSEADYGIETYAYTFTYIDPDTQAEVPPLASTTLTATESISISAPYIGISNIALTGSTAETSLTATSGTITINSDHMGVAGFFDGTGTSTVALSADTITIGAASAGGVTTFAVYAGDYRSGAGDGGQTTIDIQATSKLEITADFIAQSGVSGAVINLNKDGTGTSKLTGGAYSANGGVINIGLNEGGSTWTGFAQDNRADSSKKAGEINVTAAEGATWNVRPVTLEVTKNSSSPKDPTVEKIDALKSYLTSWNSTGASSIDLRIQGVDGYSANYQTVDIGTLSGAGTTFKVNTDVNGDRGEGKSTDQAVIHTGSGEHYINVAISGTEYGEAQKDYIVLHLEENNAASTERTAVYDGDDSYTIEVTPNGKNDLSFVLVDSNGKTTATVAQGLYYYSLVTREAQDDVKTEYNLEEGKGTEWYLVRTSANVDDPSVTPDPEPEPEPPPTPEPGPGPSPDPETNEGRTVAALAGIGNKLSMHYAQLSDLRKRLGEVRYGAQDGLWVRYIYQRNRYDGVSSNVSARQNMHALNLGLDHIVSKDESNMWLLGGDFKLGHDNERIKSARGKGNLNSYGLDLYATYANQYGCYADFVLSFDKYHQKLGSKLEDNSSASGRFNSWGWGASIEAGKMFSFKQNDENWGPWNNHWWIEPQAQLSYYWIKGKDFSMNNDMTVSQHNGDSLVGRLGVVVGKQWSYGGSSKADKRYVQAYLKGGVKHEFLGNQKTKINGVNFDHNLRGTTGYYGAGVDWNLTKQVKAYAQVEKDAGGRYKKDIEASIGLKWQF